MSTSPNLLISHISSSQASKEVTANAAFDDLDLALTNEFIKNIMDADYSLADPTEARQNMVFVFTGALTADRHIVVPNSPKLYIVSNQTTGSHNLIVETTSDAFSPFVIGSTVTVTPTEGYAILYCDGINVVQIGYLIGTTAGTVAAGNDSRITGAEQTSNKDAANGYAGLDGSTHLKTTEFPALTGDVTSTAGGVATSVVKVNGASVPASDNFVGTNSSSQFVAAPYTPENLANKDAASGYAGLDANTKLSRHEVLGHYTVSGLPAGTEGDVAYATDGRKVGEGAGLGTGVPVYYSTDGGSPPATGWHVFSTDALVQS